MFATNTLFILGLGLSPIMLMAVAICSMRGPKRAHPAWNGPQPSRPLRIPSAEETAESVRRFCEVAERAMMIDFIWDRYSKGRALFLGDMRRAAAQGKKRTGTKSKAAIPTRL
jgi:hypothetical protein